LLSFQVVILCLSAWLVPLQQIPILVNNINLYRQSRDAASDALLCVFLARELSVSDGLSRLNRSQLSLKLQDVRIHLVQSLKHMRLGGGGVQIGADHLESPLMDRYRAAMYQVGCQNY
jgi:hypothetical protein